MLAARERSARGAFVARGARRHYQAAARAVSDAEVDEHASDAAPRPCTRPAPARVGCSVPPLHASDIQRPVPSRRGRAARSTAPVALATPKDPCRCSREALWGYRGKRVGEASHPGPRSSPSSFSPAPSRNHASPSAGGSGSEVNVSRSLPLVTRRPRPSSSEAALQADPGADGGLHAARQTPIGSRAITRLWKEVWRSADTDDDKVKNINKSKQGHKHINNIENTYTN